MNDNKILSSDVERAIDDVIKIQSDIGIDIITDGEISRENYIYSFCRTLKGIDFNKLTPKVLRDGAYIEKCPTITSKLEFKEGIYHSEGWKLSNKIATKYNKRLKFTIPGPMTICDTISDEYYKCNQNLCKDLSKLIRREILYLQNIGCENIQIDEPVFARYPKEALEWGIDLINDIINNMEGIFFTIHICCGYPSDLDQVDYKKAPPKSYDLLAEKLDNSLINAISIEDAHCHCDLLFLKKIKQKKIVLGVIAIAKSKIESQEEIKSRIDEALKYIDKKRLIIAPDCGLGFLPEDILKQKLNNMVMVAKSY